MGPKITDGKTAARDAFDGPTTRSRSRAASEVSIPGSFHGIDEDDGDDAKANQGTHDTNARVNTAPSGDQELTPRANVPQPAPNAPTTARVSGANPGFMSARRDLSGKLGISRDHLTESVGQPESSTSQETVAMMARIKRYQQKTLSMQENLQHAAWEKEELEKLVQALRNKIEDLETQATVAATVSTTANPTVVPTIEPHDDDAVEVRASKSPSSRDPLVGIA